MTKEQFNALASEEEVKIEDTIWKVQSVYPLQGIIMVYCHTYPERTVPFRYENCEIVEKDLLRKYLRSDCRASSEEEDLKNIRAIVFSELVQPKPELKFPTLEDFLDYAKGGRSFEAIRNWFIIKTKRLNS